MGRGWASLTVAVCLLGCPEDDGGNAPAVSAGSASTLGPGSGPATTTGAAASTGPSSSGSDPSMDSGSGSDDTGTGSGSTSSGGGMFTSGPVETGSETTCGDFAERYVQCVDPTGSVVSAENDCADALLDGEKFGLACATAVEERYICLTGVTCQALFDWDTDNVVPDACRDEFDAVDLNCPS